MTGTEFDKLASEYSDILDRTVRFSGSGRDYFDAYKLQCLKDTGISPNDALDILDFGCGTGQLADLMAGAFPKSKVVGIDVSGSSIEVAREKFRNVKNLVFGRHLEPGRTYDLICAASVFHHVPAESRSALLISLKNALKRGGMIAVFEHNPWNPLTRYVVQTCPFDAGAELISRRRFVKLAHEAGMSIAMKRYTVFFPKFAQRLRPLEPMLRFLPLGAQYLLVMVLPKSEPSPDADRR
jgi:2-polyprenyl-3-methyl-5-hydroxy-6-metoxy-1,4-benzoquinol methylase